MRSSKANLFLRLHKWAVRQDENFLTEAFAYLLQYLLDHEPEAAIRILDAITHGFFRPDPPEAGSVEVRTQVILSGGIPDIVLRAPNRLAYVEVKAEAGVAPDELVDFRRLLRASGVSKTCLVLLTRHFVDVAGLSERPDAPIRWYQVADWIEQERSRYVFQAVSTYLVDQFIGFLEARNMIMEQVTWELPGGVRALRSFGDMLYEVAASQGLQVQLKANPSWLGVYLDRRSYWLGIYFDRPEVLVFETYYRRVNPETAARLGIEGVYECKDQPGHYWRRELNLQSEEAAFFARSKARQMQLLEEFLRGCLETVKKIEVPGEPADIPSGTEARDEE